jgi:hypothetical protein
MMYAIWVLLALIGLAYVLAQVVPETKLHDTDDPGEGVT